MFHDRFTRFKARTRCWFAHRRSPARRKPGLIRVTPMRVYFYQRPRRPVLARARGGCSEVRADASPAADRIARIACIRDAARTAGARASARIPVAGKYRERDRTSGTNGGGALSCERKEEGHRGRRAARENCRSGTTQPRRIIASRSSRRSREVARGLSFLTNLLLCKRGSPGKPPAADVLCLFSALFASNLIKR